MSRFGPMLSVCTALLLLSWTCVGMPVFGQEGGGSIPFEALLQQGKVVEAEQLLGKAVGARPDDDNARFALGVVQFLHSVETRMQVFHRYGIRTEANGPISLSNLPITPNPQPDPLDYQTARRVLQGWNDDLARVEATLAQVRSTDVKLPLHFGLIRLDCDGDGKSGAGETLWEVYKNFNRNAAVSAEAAQGFVLACDRGDVDWLRGYCHLLSALTDALLAYDFEDLFHRSGYLFFGGIKAPEAFLVAKPDQDQRTVGQILDLVALVHLIRLPLAEPARLQSVLAHLEAMVSLSRSSWRFILAETDDDHEWIPNPHQTTVVRNGQVTPEMVQTWTQFLDEFAVILAGKKLVPFWRGDDPRQGINLRRILTEPRPFDLVLWVQGTALTPYLEVGELSSPATWSRVNQVFRGEFIGFAIWFN